MQQVYRIDANGYYVEPVLIDEDEETPPDCVETPFQDGMYKPQWDGTQWVEGLTQEEVEAIRQEQEKRNSLPSDSKRLKDLEDAVFQLMLMQ